MINIGINANEANVEHRVGVGQFAFELIRHLYELSGEDLTFRIYLSSPPRVDFPKESDHWKYKIIPVGRFWTLTKLQQSLIHEKTSGKAPDVFLTLTHYSPIFMPIPSVISIMDLAFERFPQFFERKDLYKLKYWTRLSALFARKIITISEFSRGEIAKVYGVPREKIVVVYPGYDTLRFNDKLDKSQATRSKIRANYNISGGYFLYIGTLQPRKNLGSLIEAFASLSRKNLTLVLVGMKSEGRGGWMFERFFDKVKELGIEKRVLFTGYVPDEDIPLLLSGSLAYVLPSLYEGFGIPVVEAMASGVPVVVADNSSLREVCGEAPVYIGDSMNPSSIRTAMETVLEMKATELVNRIKLGQGWVKRYNWDTAAKKTLETLYEAVDR